MRISRRLGRFLCRYRGRCFTEAIGRSVDAFHRCLNNVDFNMVRNGELRVLKLLSKFNPKCIFDVGANKGEWCQMATTLFPSCMIHAFEIVPSTYMELIRNTENLQNIIPNNFGLSSEEGVISVSLGSNDKMATGCKINNMQFYDEYYNQEIECKTRRASDYLKEKAIKSIDFLKVDVEGMDFNVIEGFGDQIKNVKVVQFEYGIFNIASRHLLTDFYRHFKNNGFVVGKIFPKYVNFFDYNFDMENFQGSNYLAVKSEENELISSLSHFGE